MERRDLARDYGRFPWELDTAPQDDLKVELALRRLEQTYHRRSRHAPDE